MSAFRLRPKKSLGQHFLRDSNILRKIVDSLALKNDDVVLEIGAGEGALTRLLVTYPITLFAVELDDRVIPQLTTEFGSRARILHADICKLNLQELSGGRSLRVVGNIPYYLTSEILFHLFRYHTVITDATLMMQLEVAQRLVAQPNSKEYGILSVATQFYGKPELLFRVSRNVFFPKPSVDSAVLRISMNTVLPTIDVQLFSAVVRGTFGKRRKTLRNSLKYLGVPPEIITSLPLDVARRPESLTVDDFILLTQHLSHISLDGHEKF